MTDYSLKDLLKYMFGKDFHNLYNLLNRKNMRHHSSECERTHSNVARVKKAVRCSMTDDRLEHLNFFLSTWSKTYI